MDSCQSQTLACPPPHPKPSGSVGTVSTLAGLCCYPFTAGSQNRGLLGYWGMLPNHHPRKESRKTPRPAPNRTEFQSPLPHLPLLGRWWGGRRRGAGSQWNWCLPPPPPPAPPCPPPAPPPAVRSVAVPPPPEISPLLLGRPVPPLRGGGRSQSDGSPHGEGGTAPQIRTIVSQCKSASAPSAPCKNFLWRQNCSTWAQNGLIPFGKYLWKNTFLIHF